CILRFPAIFDSQFSKCFLLFLARFPVIKSALPVLNRSLCAQHSLSRWLFRLLRLLLFLLNELLSRSPSVPTEFTLATAHDAI
ncbi:MAG: hypothetical protein QF565_13915, partial [Arenicellales bacterium]|nr:hypothetical protein [Arenicellales bacterium]